MRNLEKALVAFSAAVAIGVAWNSQRNPPKVHLGETRIHHYHVGGLLALLGLISGSPTAVGFGTGLILHDIDDIPHK
jgi:hypothetical protein